MPDTKNDDTSKDDVTMSDSKTTSTSGTPEEIEALVSKRAEEMLRQMKENVDKAYKARDEANAKAAMLAKEKQDAEIKRLQEEGKHREAYEIQLQEERAARTALEQRNVELTRDMEVRSALSGLEFRSDKAREMAYAEIVGGLIKTDTGIWVHRTGAAVSDFIRQFAESQDNAFLFKQKASSGSGSGSLKPSPTDKKGSIFEMSQEEVLKRAREGTLRKR